MASRKIVLKTARSRKGTISRAAIRKAVQNVFGGSKAARPAQSAKATAVKRTQNHVLPAL